MNRKAVATWPSAAVLDAGALIGYRVFGWSEHGATAYLGLDLINPDAVILSSSLSALPLQPRPNGVEVRAPGGMRDAALTGAQVAVITNEGLPNEKQQTFRVPMRAAGELTLIKSFTLP